MEQISWLEGCSERYPVVVTHQNLGDLCRYLRNCIGRGNEDGNRNENKAHGPDR